MAYLVFLFYYSLIISTLLFVWSFLFADKPTGFLIVILILPISMYFWLRLRRAKANSEDQIKKVDGEGKVGRDSMGTVLFLSLGVILTLFASAVSLYAYFLYSEFGSEETNKYATKDQIESISKNNEELNTKVDELGRQLSDLGDFIKDSNVLGMSKLDSSDEFMDKISDITGAAGLNDSSNVKINGQNLVTVDAYKDKNTTSEIVGKVKTGSQYELVSKEGNWYLLKVSLNVEGWVEGRFIDDSAGGQ